MTMGTMARATMKPAFRPEKGRENEVRDREAHVRAQHVEGAMPEIDDAHKTEYDRKTQGQQNPEGALHQTQEQVLGRTPRTQHLRLPKTRSLRTGKS